MIYFYSDHCIDSRHAQENEKNVRMHFSRLQLLKRMKRMLHETEAVR